MKSLKKMLMLFSLAMALTMTVPSFSITVFAALDESVKSYLDEHYEGGSGGKNDCAASVSKYFVTKADAKNTQPIQIGTSTNVVVLYYDPANEDAINAAVRKVNESSDITSKVNDMTAGFNINADVETASVMLGGLSGFVSIVIGLICVLVTLGVTFYTGIDIMYLAFPVFRGKCEESKESGGVMAKKEANGNVKMRWISDEAQYVAQKATLNDGKNPYIAYLWKRSIAYVFIVVMLFIFMTGNISLITNLGLRAVSGLLEVLQGI